MNQRLREPHNARALNKPDQSPQAPPGAKSCPKQVTPLLYHSCPHLTSATVVFKLGHFNAFCCTGRDREGSEIGLWMCREEEEKEEGSPCPP